MSKQWYAGIDPGFSGAIGRMDVNGRHLHVEDLPVTGKGKGREFDIVLLAGLLYSLKQFPQMKVGLEWPTTRPGEGAERCERFGRGKGYLHMGLSCYQVPYELISPTKWKGQLNLPGKTKPDANKICKSVFLSYYPAYEHLITGPRGGYLDGRCEAFLIAHWMRTRSVAGMRAVVEQFGRGSAEAMTLALTGGRKRRRKT